MKQKVFKTLIFCLCFVIVIFAFMFGTWIVDRNPPGAYIGIPKVLYDNEIKQGSNIIVQYEVYRYRSCPLKVERVMYDGMGIRYSLPDYDLASAGDMGPQTLRVKVNIPYGMEKGKSEYRVMVSYYCNPLHYIWPIVVIAPIAYFEIK